MNREEMSHNKNISICASGNGLICGEVDKPCEFRVTAKGVDVEHVSVQIEKPHRTELHRKNNKNGISDIVYYPTSPGEYVICIKHGDKHIEGSPFKAKITTAALKLENSAVLNSLGKASISLEEPEVTHINGECKISLVLAGN
jgi:hypothetical protein